MNLAWVDFITACLLMGAGIGADVALATLSRASTLTSRKMVTIWVVGVSLTHTLFPMLGYITAYFSVNALPWLTPFVGFVAFACIAWYLITEIRGLTTSESSENNQTMLITLGLILAVSWDALWSGPAKSAQVVGWPELAVWASFVMVGIAVALLTLGSFVFSKWLKNMFQPDGRAYALALWLQYSVIGYFGILALMRYTLGWQVTWLYPLTLSIVIVGAALLRTLNTAPKPHFSNS